MNQAEEKSFRSFLIIWVGQLLSNIGSGLTAFSLGIYVFEKTNSATSYSLVILLAFLPSFLLKPLGGVLSDRHDRKLMMILGDIGSSMGLVLIVYMLSIGSDAMWPIYLGVAVSSLFTAIQNPAYKAAITDLVKEEAYSKASGLMQLAESSRFLISPIVAGFLFNFMTIETILLIDVATFVLAASAVLWIKTSQKKSNLIPAHGNFLADFMKGFTYVFAHKGIVLLLTITSLITFSIGFLQSLLGPMILAFTDSQTLGITMTVSASGMVISSLLLGFFSKTANQATILSTSLALTGLTYALLGVSTNITFIMVAGFLFFLTLPFVNTSLDVLLRKNIENTMQGRVWSIVSLLSQLGMVISFSLAGLLADHVFNPLFQSKGFFYSTIGEVIGTGPGRGIGFMFILSGLSISLIAMLISKIKTIQALDR